MQAAKLIGSSPLVTSYAYSCSFFNLNSIYAQSLRWKRKPIWLPTAKTKVFRVPVRPKIPDDEFQEIQRLYNNYRTYHRSVRTYMKELAQRNKTELDQSIIDKAEEEDYDQCLKINEEWNKKIAAMREVRLQQEREARTLKALEGIQFKKKQNEENRQLINEKIKQAKLLAPTFITSVNIDQAIEEALADTVDYNKALTIDGDWYTEKVGIITANKAINTQLKK